MDFFLSLIVLAIGAALAAAMAWAIIVELQRLFGGSLRSSRLRRAFQRVQEADLYIEKKDFVAAIDELERALLLDVRGTERTLRSIKEHHQNILSRCVIIGESIGAHLSNLPDVERYLLERSELQLLRANADQAFGRLKSKRQTAGKELPAWSKNDFDRRKREIVTELDANLASLRPALDEL
ncbi:MAG: hypothetical protein KDD44_14625, partial [Bdellovibrionales bacterium]|nr:hypothetical protein [Bdellovibrionales bacterium]